MPGPIRGGVACGISDDHPRHVIAVVGGTSVPFHMDCHAATGCETCIAQIADANGVQGGELRTHLIALGEEARHG